MIINVPLDKITDNPYQARQTYDDVDDLAARIRAAMIDYPETLGLMQVPVGRFVDSDGTAVDRAFAILDELQDGSESAYDRIGVRVQLAFGHRRLRAFRTMPYDVDDVMPVNILDLTDDQMLDAVWSENRERKDISAVEEAQLLARKLDELGNQQAVADAWGLARSTVANRLRLLELPEQIQQANRDGRLSERQALALAPIIQIQERLNGREGGLKWGKDALAKWGDPVAPADFVAHVLEHPETPSDAARDYRAHLLRHAGKQIPDVVATTGVDPDEHPEIYSPLCKGCLYRIDQSCLRPACLEVKKTAVSRQIAETAAEELGLPYSDDDDHFTDDVAIPRLFKYGLTGFLVVGWGQGWHPRLSEEKGAAMEFVGSDWVWKNDGRAGLMLGHRKGKVTDEELAMLKDLEAAEKASQPEDPDRPARSVLEAWLNAIEDYEISIRAAVKELLTRHADEELGGLWNVMRPIYGLMAYDMASPDYVQPGRAFVEKLFDRAFYNQPRVAGLSYVEAVGWEYDGVDERYEVIDALHDWWYWAGSYAREKWAQAVLDAAETWQRVREDERDWPIDRDEVDRWLPVAVEQAQEALAEDEEE